MACIENREK